MNDEQLYFSEASSNSDLVLYNKPAMDSCHDHVTSQKILSSNFMNNFPVSVPLSSFPTGNFIF